MPPPNQPRKANDVTTTLRITIDIETLGRVPEYQQDCGDAALDHKIAAYFDNGLDDEPIERQLKHFGARAARKMISNEIISWLADLGTTPAIVSITEHNAE